MDSPPPARTDWTLVGLIFLAGVVAASQQGKAPPSLPALRLEMGLSLVAAGWVVAMFNLVGAATGSLVGALGDWLGHRRLVLSGLTLTGLAGLAGSLTQGEAGLLASRFAEGLGYLLVTVCAPALVVRVALPSDLRVALALWSAFMPTGSAAIMLLSPLLLGHFGWRGLWLANGLAILAFALLLGRASRSLTHLAIPVSLSGRSKELISVATKPGPLLLGLCFGLYALQFMAVFGFLPILLIEELGRPPAAAAILSAAVVAANIPGNLLGGWLLQRGARRVTVLAWACLAMALSGLGIYSAALAGPLRYALAVIFSALGGMIPAALFNAAPRHAPAPHLTATATGLMMQGASLGSAVGPPLLAWVVGLAGGWRGGAWLLATVAVLDLIAALALGRLEKKGA